MQHRHTLTPVTGSRLAASRARRRLFSPLLVMGLAVHPCPEAQADPGNHSLRVGVYNNPPKIFLDSAKREVSGIFGDLLGEIARRENWQLEAVPCVWHQCLEWLQQGHIDLLPDVALTDSRQQKFDFHNTPALLSWSQLYAGENVTIANLLDLDRKTIAVLRDSVQQQYLQQLAGSFQLTVTWMPVDTIAEGFAAVTGQRAAAMATNRFTGEQHAHELSLIATPVIFQPSRLYFATGQQRHSDILATIENHLARWQQDPESYYYRTLDRWHDNLHHHVIPLYMHLLLGGLLVALFLVVAISLLLKHKVGEKNRQLHDNKQYLDTLLSNVDAHIYIKDAGYRYRYANQRLCETLGLPLQQIIGKQDSQLYTPECSYRIEQNDMKVLQQGERVAEEENYETLPAVGEVRTYLSIKQPLRTGNGRIHTLFGISTDITETRDTRKQLHQLSFFDPLTSLPNYRRLMQHLEQGMSHFQQTGSDHALLLINLDNFKRINVSLGQKTCDAILVTIARQIQHHLGSNDIAGRLNGDEFAVILGTQTADGTAPLQKATDYAKTLKQDLRRLEQDANSPQISLSVGIALFSDTPGGTEGLLKAAQLALHKAKNSRNDSICCFTPAMQIEFSQRMRHENRLRLAPDNGSLSLFLQPQVDQQGRIVGMEGLLRWHDSDLGAVSPAAFIPLAEETGLIIPLGTWVIETACRYLAHWRTVPGMQHVTLSINISPRQFRHKQFILQIRSAIERYRIPAALLKLEITESLLIDNLEESIAIMKELESLGIRFALDDFGTGYASLGYLKRLPLYQLKIDQSFVRHILVDASDEAIVQAVILMGQSLGLQVIAEGVETDEQARRLMKRGCHLFQGYYYGRPESFDHWTAQLSQTASGRQPA